VQAFRPARHGGAEGPQTQRIISMTMRLALLFAFVSVALNAQAPAGRKKAPAESAAARAARIHKEAIVVDNPHRTRR